VLEALEMKRFAILISLVMAVVMIAGSPALSNGSDWLKAVGKAGIILALANPSEREINLSGDELSQQIRSESIVHRDVEVSDVVRTIALAKGMRCPDTRVIDQRDEAGNPVLNAFAIPGTNGGYIYVTEGMLGFLKRKDPLKWKDDLAGILAHELGHIDLKHAKRGTKDSLLYQVLVSTALEGFKANDTLSIAAMFLNTSLRESSYSRNLEREADSWGLEATELAGYDPYALPRTFKIMREEEGDVPSCLKGLSDHPTLASRERNLTAKLDAKKATLTTTDTGSIPAPEGVEKPTMIKVSAPTATPSVPSTAVLPSVRIILNPKKFEGPMPMGGPEQFVAWVNEGLIGSNITVVLRGEDYDAATVEQNLAGVDPETKVESGRFYGATGEANIIASCTDGYKEQSRSTGDGIILGGSMSQYEKKYFAHTNGTITNFSFETLAVTDVTESASFEAAVSESSKEVHLPGIDVSSSQGGNVEQVVVDNAWRALANGISDKLRSAIVSPQTMSPAKPKVQSFKAHYVVFKGPKTLKQAKIGQVFNVLSGCRGNMQVGQVEVVSFQDSADTAMFFGVNPSPVYMGFPIGKWLSWTGTAQDDPARLVFVPVAS
jgi:Zn-dependent protease with chaperone function